LQETEVHAARHIKDKEAYEAYAKKVKDHKVCAACGLAGGWLT
jgi:hypothetical protein